MIKKSVYCCIFAIESTVSFVMPELPPDTTEWIQQTTGEMTGKLFLLTTVICADDGCAVCRAVTDKPCGQLPVQLFFQSVDASL